MNKYEIMFIVNPTLEEATINKVAEDMKNIILNAKGEVTEEQAMGQRDLAYEINKHKKGYYFFYKVNADAETVKEFNRLANVNENVIRHLIVKVEK